MNILLHNPVFDFIFTSKKISWFWFIVRVYLGWQWIVAGYEKIINPAWTGSSAGGALTGFVNNALTKTSGAHPDVASWYGWFLQNAVLPKVFIWSHLVAYGEFLIGVGLILGALTFVSAFFSFFLNMNFLMAGTVSVNPQFLILALCLMLAYRVSGYIGLDYFLLRMRRQDSL